MITELSRAERSRLHLAIFDAVVLPDEPQSSPDAASREALAELLAFYHNHPKLAEIMQAADAARAEIECQTGNERTPIEFDIPSLKMATNLTTVEAELVARLCGASPKKRAGFTIWVNSDERAALFKFPADIMEHT